MKLNNGTCNDKVIGGLDDIYHSTSMHEMQVKADLHSIDLHESHNIEFLIDTTTYHHAFWPHTAKRFTAFKELLKSMKDLPSISGFNELVMHVEKEIAEYEANKWRRCTPGGKQEIKNLKQVLRILENLKENYEKRQK